MESLDAEIKEPCRLSLEQLSRLPDQDLLQHLRSRHGDALAVLFTRYHRLILSVAFKILRDPAEAEDVMQSVFLEIYKAAGQFDPSRGTVKVWLLQYAYHRSLSRREYLRVRGFYERSRREPRPSNFGESFRGDALLTHPEAHRLVREGLDSLNYSQRMVLHMAYFLDMPLKDIAASTGDSLGNVRHHYYRGLDRLRSLLLPRNGNGSKRPTNKVKYEIANQGAIDAEVEIT
ncbi:MAG: sigma-70 family RNA polymerase sigma factor [Terriglobia bacterium]